MKKIYLLLAWLAAVGAYAQDGALDTSFNANLPIQAGGTMGLDSSENPIIAYTVSGSTPVVKKYDSTGNPISSLNVTAFSNGYITALCVLTNGDIVIGGNFTNYNGSGQNYLIKVSSTGVFYSSFLPTIPADMTIRVIKQQPGTGRILVGGLSNYGNSLKCFTASGTTDTTFNSGNAGIAPASGISTVNDIAFYPNGDLIIGGTFSSYNGVTRQNVARLYANGTLDSSFNVTGINGFLSAIAIDGNASVLLGGDFALAGTTRLDIIRVSGSGSLDTGFSDPAVTGTGSVTDVKAVAVLSDGKILVGGTFGQTGGLNRNGISRLLSNGGTDYCFNPGTGLGNPYSNVKQLFVKQDKDFFICGDFPNYYGAVRKTIAKVKGKPLTVTATPDTGTATTLGGTAVANVIANDFSGSGAATFSNSTISTVSSTSSFITLNNSTGAVTVANGIAAGTYYLVYQICQQSPSCTCDSATVTITVTYVPPVHADNDTFSFTGCATTVVGNVLTNDDYGTGTNNATTSNVTIALSGAAPPSGTVTFNSATGAVSVVSGAPAGTYSFNYTICSTGSTTNCSTGSVSVTVNSLPPVVATADNYTAVSGASTSLPNILSNDTYNGSGASLSNITISYSSSYPGIITSTAGFMWVGTSVAPGVYPVTYTLTDINNPCNTSTAVACIVVLAPITAVNDTVTAALGEASYFNILTNDTYSGIAASPSNVSISVIGAFPSSGSILFNSATGQVGIPSTAVAGTYTFTYKICANATVLNCNSQPVPNCSTATVTVTIATPGLVPGTRANNRVAMSGLMGTGQVMIGGIFTQYNDQPANNVTRLKTNLGYDATYLSTGPYPNGYLEDLKVQPNDYTLVAGSFPGFNNTNTQDALIRLRPDGTTDTAFNAGGAGITGSACNCQQPSVNSVALLPSGNIVAVGNFTGYNGNGRNFIVGLNPAGGLLSPSVFQYTTGISGMPTIAATDNLGKVMISGFISRYNGLPVKTLIRIKSDGTLDDPDFHQKVITYYACDYPNIGAIMGEINAISFQPDNFIIIGGYFVKYDNVLTGNIARLMPNGELDTNFNAGGTGFDGMVNAISIQPSGDIIVGGSFTTYNGIPVNTIVRLTASGALDTSFYSGTGPAGNVYTLTRQPIDGKVIVGGRFITYNGIYAGNVTRIVPATGAQAKGFEYWESEPAFNSIDGKNVKVYPNPGTGLFTIDLSGYNDTNFKVTVYNTLGQLVYTGAVSSQNSNVVDLTGVENGAYYITLQNAGETINKIVLKK